MQRLYSDSGSSDYEVLGPRYSSADWETLRETLRQLLTKRKQDGALKLLDRFDWTVVEGTNVFGDEFGMLYARVPLARYAENGHLPSTRAAREAAKTLAAALTEITPERPYIRHVGYALDSSAPQPMISSPEPQFSSRTVQLALGDADRLLSAGSAVSAVDRVHTALMGYLRLICTRLDQEFSETEGAATLLKKIFGADPTISKTPHSEHTLKILRSMGAILDAFEPVRNRGSVAHANEQLLEEPEAELMINVARTLFHYLDGRVPS